MYKVIKMLKYTLEYIVSPEDTDVKTVLDEMQESGEGEVVDIEIIEREVS